MQARRGGRKNILFRASHVWVRKGGERKGLGLYSGRFVPSAGHFGFGWVLEDEGVFIILESSFGVVLH